ncbi:MAG: hypothetical protein JWR26_1258, partial [Pedosphaera sp.]|nr:hypothetical protein [Pedosphaera sp.]
MKKLLYTLALLGLASIPVRAQVQFYEPFTYPNGNITNVSGGVWQTHSGTGGDSLISSNKYQIFGTRTDDVNRTFPTNSSTPMYVAFTINMSSLPTNPFGTYFAHFKDNTISNFRGRIHAVTSANAPYNVYPGMYRLGVSFANNDGNGASTNGPSAVFPMDLALNTDYQVVMMYDDAGFGATLWVNPATSGDPSVGSSDLFPTGLTNGVSSFAFRQASGEGKQTIDNMVVGLNFADVVTNVPASAPFFGLQPVGYTNYSGNILNLVSAASGTGQLFYQWNQDGNPIPGANSRIYTVSSVQASDSGTYTVTISNAVGSVTSAGAPVVVNGTPTPPVITSQPQSVTNQVSKPVTFSANVEGTGPLSYQWYFNDLSTPIPGATGSSYSIAQINTNNAGTYFVVATGGVSPAATSQSATLTVTPVSHVSIAFLRSLEDTNTWATTDTTTLWNITGTVINGNNLTSGNTASYYLQDSTAGINLFISGTAATSFRPALGDIVTATGPLTTFSQSLELNLDATNPFHTYADIGHTNALPAPVVFSFLSTNNLPYMEALNGSFIMLTNVSFVKGGGTNVLGTANIVTSSSGVTFNVFVSNQTTNA